MLTLSIDPPPETIGCSRSSTVLGGHLYRRKPWPRRRRLPHLQLHVRSIHVCELPRFHLLLAGPVDLYCLRLVLQLLGQDQHGAGDGLPQQS